MRTHARPKSVGTVLQHHVSLVALKDNQTLRDLIFPAKNIQEYSGKELTIALLGMAAVGILLTAVLVAPNLALLYKHFGARTKTEKYRISRRVRYLVASGLVHRSGAYCVPSSLASAMLARAILKVQALLPQRRWDGIWHLVLFDLPLQHERARRDLRSLLNDLGFVHYQQSVFVHRFDFKKLIVEYCALYDIREYVNFVTATHLDNETLVRDMSNKIVSQLHRK